MTFDSWKTAVLRELASDTTTAIRYWNEVERVMGRNFWREEWEDDYSPAEAAKCGVLSTAAMA